MKFQEIPTNTPDDEFVFIECDITGKTKKTKYGKAKANVAKNNGQYITNWGIAKLDNPMKRKDVQDKIKQTCLEKYGTECSLNTKKNMEKRLEKMFGSQEAIDARTEKTKQTNLKKFGVEHAAQAEICKQKTLETFREKYNADHPLQNPEILAKVQATNLERYGDICALNNPEIKAKALKSLFNHYGVEYYNQLPEMKEYLRENCRIWLKKSWENPWAKGITRPEEWNEKQRKTVLQLILDGKWLGGYCKGKIQGWYNPLNAKCHKKNPYFRSGSELVTHHYLQFNDKVEWYDYEPFGIDYTLPDGSLHVYIVDFAVKYLNNDKIHLVEVKPRFKLTDSKVISKKEAATKLAEVEDLIYEYWDEYIIKAWGYKQTEILKLPYVKLRSKNES